MKALEKFNNLYKKLINEDVFKDDDFSKLLSFLKELNSDSILLTPKKLAEFFPVSSKVRKTLLKKTFKSNLYVAIVDPESFEDISKHIKSYLKIASKAETNQITLSILNAFEDEASAVFFTNNDKGMMFLRKGEFNLGDLKHEFMHFCRWATYDETEEVLDVNSLPEKRSKTLSRFMVLFDVDEYTINYFCQKNEFETILNNGIDSVKEMKAELFADMDEKAFRDFVMKTLFFDEKRSDPDKYLDSLEDSEIFDFIISHISLKFIVFNVVIGNKVQSIKTHLFSMI